MGKRAIYMECTSGISGDMTVASLLDLGASEEVLRKVLKSLPLTGYEVSITRVKKSGIDACDFNVILDRDNHDHDMAYLHGHEHGHYHEHGYDHEHDHEHGHDHEHDHDHDHDHDHEHDHDHDHDHDHEHVHGHEHGHDHDHEHEYDHDHEHGHDHDHEHGHHHDHEHDHDHDHDHGHYHDHEHDHDHDHDHDHGHSHGHDHRGLREITEIIEAGEMTERARSMALRIFRIIAEAESKAHNMPLENVHFHEVGAVDSIVDVVSAAVCLDNLDVQEVIISALTEGTGTIRCQHGILPVPVPAVVNIVAAEKLELHISNVRGELVTPTGAAIAAAFATRKHLPESFYIVRTGIGAGKRKYECPGLLRSMLIEYDTGKNTAGNCAGGKRPDADFGESSNIICMETNIDDCSGEILGHTLEKLMSAGARDAFFQPVFMKKNRPGWLLTVICDEANREILEQIIFRETTTIGIRHTSVKRTVLDREVISVPTALGEAKVKKCSSGNLVRYYPEYESAVHLCEHSGLPLQDVYNVIQKAVDQSFQDR